MMKYFFFLILVACASKPQQLSEKARELEVFANKPTQCHVVGKVVGKNKMGSTELALNDAKNQAAELDATGIHVNQEVPNGNHRTVYATAYKCD
jgi:hypothetical protein